MKGGWYEQVEFGEFSPVHLTMAEIWFVNRAATPAHILVELSKHPKENVRAGVANNESTPLEVLEFLKTTEGFAREFLFNSSYPLERKFTSEFLKACPDYAIRKFLGFSKSFFVEYDDDGEAFVPEEKRALLFNLVYDATTVGVGRMFLESDWLWDFLNEEERILLALQFGGANEDED